MSNYVFGTNLSYQDYLQAKSFERSLKSEISSSTKSLIASNEELQRENISVLKDLSSSVSSGFENISIELADLSAGMAELNATFQWGFSELLTQASRINDSLEELVRLAKTPAQTWAYEQFEIARDADRKGLYEEAIEYLDRAINGYGGQTGYKLEYRFHFLLGRIRLGSFRNHSREIVSQEDAEKSFLCAARYAAQDAPNEAARALLAAGWAAYSRGEMTKAQDYTKQAISFDTHLAEAHFQLAKVLMHANNPDEALPSLEIAVDLDRGYTIKVAIDDDFKPYGTQVNSLFEKKRIQAKEKFEDYLAAINEQQMQLERERATRFQLIQNLDLQRFNEAIEEGDRSASTCTLYGYQDALPFLNGAENELKRLYQEMNNSHLRLLAETESAKLRQAEQEAAQAAEFQDMSSFAKSVFWLALVGIPLFFLAPLALVLGIYVLNEYRHIPRQDDRGFAIAAVVIGTLTIISLLFIWGMNLILNSR